ncbi:MAG: hydrogenase large subunit [Vulcanimicrobiaceae bacterium]
MYRETRVPLAQVRDHVVNACRTSEPLGVFASGQHVYYLFLEQDGVLSATVTVGGMPLPSLAADLPLYDWHEREMRQKQGIILESHPDSRPLFFGCEGPPEALTAEGKGVSVVVVGPVHAGVIEPGRFTFSTGGETTIHLDAQFSYSHRNIERFLEGHDALEAAWYVGRICGGCSVARSWAYARALEQLAGVQCDEQSEYARVIFAEFERIYNHVFDLASCAAGAGYGRGQAVGLGLKERVLRLCADVAGHRLLFDAVQPGGVRFGVLRQPSSLRVDLSALRSDIDRFTEDLFENRSVMRRFEGSGVVTAQVARVFGAVGPARRASGGEIDVRSFSPYGAYRKLDVQRAGAYAGDVSARCSVKRAEIDESFRLVELALGELGNVPVSSPKEIAIGEGAMTAATEGPRGAETVSIECDRSGRLQRLHAISASYRNWPVVVRAMEGNIIPDFPLINKSFNLCYSCADR